MKYLLLLSFLIVQVYNVAAQVTYPVNGSYDKRPGLYAFINATIVVNAEQTISNGVLLVKNQKIEAVGQGIIIPNGYIKIDLKGKFIYPSFVDAFTSYGLASSQSARQGGGFGRTQVFTSTKAGAYAPNHRGAA